MRWLSGYAQDRFAPANAVAPVIMGASSPATSLAAGVRRAAHASKLDSSALQSHALHLACSGVLEVDLDQPLSLESRLASTGAEENVRGVNT